MLFRSRLTPQRIKPRPPYAPPRRRLPLHRRNRVGDALIVASVLDTVRPRRRPPGPKYGDADRSLTIDVHAHKLGVSPAPFWPCPLSLFSSLAADSPAAAAATPPPCTRPVPGLTGLRPVGSGWWPACAPGLGRLWAGPFGHCPGLDTRPGLILGRPKAGSLGHMPGLLPGLAGLRPARLGNLFSFLF